MRIFFAVSLVLCSFAPFAQTVFQSTLAGGNWFLGTTWDQTACASGCIAGVDYPGANDIAIILVNSGNGVTINRGQTANVKDLLVVYNIANALRVGTGVTGTATLNINGNLQGVLDDLSDLAIPTTTVIQNNNGNLLITLTGSNLDDPSGPTITSWGHTATLRRITFNPGVGNTVRTDGFSMVSSGALTMSTGTTLLLSGQTIEDPAANATITVNTGAVFSIDGGINGGTTATQFTTLINNGTVNVNTSGYLNANNITFGSGSTMNVLANGVNQTQGWWFQNATPTGSLVLDNGTVNFSAGANQNVYAQDYGNLTLSNAGTKTVAGSGTLNVKGNLTINSATFNTNAAASVNIGGNLSNSGTWAPADLVTFNGTAAQQIGGSSSTSFGSGLTIDKSTGTLTLVQDIAVAGGLTIADGTFDLTTHTLTITNNNITNNDTFTPSTSTVVISGTTSVGGSQPTSVNNLIINGSFTSPATLNIAGDLTNNGTFNANSGTLVFNGTTNQSISGMLTANNINVTNTGSSNGVLIDGNVSLDGTLTLVNSGSKLDADGSANNGVLTVRSTSVNSGGRIATLPTPSNFTGAVTVQRFINGPDTWRYLAMPITNGNVSMWKDDFPVTGNFSDPSPAGVDGVDFSDAISIYSFNPSTNQYVGIGAGGSTASTPLSNTVGYSVYSYRSNDFTISVRGTISKSNVGVPVQTANGGYNLVPNPYPSAIDWDNVTKTGLNDAMWIRVSNNQYASYVGGVATNAPPFSGWTGEVATGQSFWVQSTGATTLTFEENDKTSNQYEFLREKEPRDYLRITMLAPVAQGKRQTDEAVIRFTDEALDGFDGSYDARKRKNGDYSNSLQRYTHVNLSSYSLNASEDYVINSVPRLQCADKSISLKVEDVPAGGYTLRFSDLDKMDVAYGILLKDKFLDSETVIEDGAEYNFNVTADALSKGAGRFELIFKPVAVDQGRALALTSVQECASPMVRLEVDNSQAGVQYTFKLNDSVLHNVISGNGQKISVSVNRSSLAVGMNKLSLVASSAAGCGEYTFNDVLNVKIDQVYDVSGVTAGQHCGEGSVTVSATGAPLDGAYRWYESATAMDPVPMADQASFTTPVLAESKVYFVSVTNASGCESAQRLPVEAKIIKIDEVSTVMASQQCGQGAITLSAEGAPKNGAYRWYETSTGVDPIAGATQSTFTTPLLAESKTYFVSVVNSSGCESVVRRPVDAKIVDIPEPVVTASGNTLTVDQQAGVQWYKDNVLVGGATASSFEVNESGVYKAVVTKDGCSAGSEELTFLISGTEDRSSLVKFYPNPASDYLHMTGVPANAVVSLYDAQGRVVDAPMDTHRDGITVDMRGLRSGIYLVGFRKQDQFLKVKVVKK